MFDVQLNGWRIKNGKKNCSKRWEKKKKTLMRLKDVDDSFEFTRSLFPSKNDFCYYCIRRGLLCAPTTDRCSFQIVFYYCDRRQRRPFVSLKVNLRKRNTKELCTHNTKSYSTNCPRLNPSASHTPYFTYYTHPRPILNT